MRKTKKQREEEAVAEAKKFILESRDPAWLYIGPVNDVVGKISLGSK